jgi:hypothetical protein
MVGVELTGERDRMYRRWRRSVTLGAATLGGLLALVGGFTAGWVAHDQTAPPPVECVEEP